MVFETASALAVVAVGSYMLYRAIGLAFLGPLAIAIISAAGPFLLGGRLQKSQRMTLEATEQRLGFMKQLMSNIRGARIEGMQPFIADAIRASRKMEIERMANYRRVEIVVLLIGTLMSVTVYVGHL